jgi:uncharacterized membrane protein
MRPARWQHENPALDRIAYGVTAMTSSARNTTIDILRGIAIFTMVAANFSASLLQTADKVLAFRLYGTFAAPLFIILAGMMVVMTQARHGGFLHYIQRGLLIIGTGCTVDMAIWGLWPLLGYDVLYLMGLAIPMVYVLARYCRPSVRLAVAAVLLASTPLLQTLLAYRTELVSIGLGDLSIQAYGQRLFSADTLQRLWLDGWFPLMPWLSFALVGSVLGNYYLTYGTLATKRLLLAALGLLVSGVGLWLWQQPELVIRDGYSELFYPPSIAYALTACGLILLGCYGVEKTRHFAIYKLFLNLGHASLFMYILHQVILVAVLQPVTALHELPFLSFFLVYLATIMMMVAIGYVLARFKKRHKSLPFLARFLLGG